MSEHPLEQVATNPYLSRDETKGWVALNDHLILLEWRPKNALSISAAYKELCERVSAEAALMKGQTEVHIRYVDSLLAYSSPPNPEQNTIPFLTF
jgi:hypothetical protein